MIPNPTSLATLVIFRSIIPSASYLYAREVAHEKAEMFEACLVVASLAGFAAAMAFGTYLIGWPFDLVPALFTDHSSAFIAAGLSLALGWMVGHIAVRKEPRTDNRHTMLDEEWRTCRSSR